MLDTLKQQITVRLDDWVNTLTNLNVLGKDKRLGAEAQAYLMSEAEAEQTYAGDDIAAKVVDMLPKDMVREGFKLKIPSWDEEEIRNFVTYLEQEMNWKATFQKALSWARLYGGSGVVLGIDDGAPNPWSPLNTNRIRRFDFATVLNRHELIWHMIDEDPRSKNMGMPLIYQMQPRFSMKGAGITMIHHSRIIRFDGATLPRQLFIQNGFWSNSVLATFRGPLSNYSQTQDGVATLMTEMAVGVFKVKDMQRLMSMKGGKNLLQERLNLMDLAKSVVNSIMIDAEEDYERKQTPLTGVADVIDRMERRLVTASGYTHTVLLGEAPGGGMGETGKSERHDYYDFVSKEQEVVLKPALRQFIKLCFLNKSGPTRGIEPPDWDIEFCPLWQEPEGEVLDRKEKQARIDDIYIKNQTITPEEIARSRFGSGEYSHETKLDFDRPTMEETPTREEVEAGLPPLLEEENPEQTTGTGGGQSNPPAVEEVDQTDDERSAEIMKDTSLNGAQVTSLITVIQEVASNRLPRETGIRIIEASFGLSTEQVESIMGEVGRSFTIDQGQGQSGGAE
jgi:phage-related protein (TIGR01555 family)